MNKIYIIFGLLLMALLAIECARPGMPGGGPKDTYPPKVTKSEPPNGSALFTAKKILITFDEFIELDNITQKAMISPPMNKQPDYKLKGKSLQIKFNEELKPNTTYSIYFADAIVDLTEKNALLNYTYIFSTGIRVDSMSLHGEVFNAFNLEPYEEVFVMLYKDNNDTLPLDSLPLNVKPYYISKTGSDGRFQLNGLSNTKYLMFALKDLNANYIYDQPGEEIAFIDSLLSPEHFGKIDLDSLKEWELQKLNDSINFGDLDHFLDSLVADSIRRYDDQFTHYELFMFDEPDSTQRLEKFDNIQKNILQFAFRWPADSIRIEALNFSADTLWHLEQHSKNNDTIRWYVKNLPMDTLELAVFDGNDTLEMITTRLDPKRDKPGLSRKQKKEEETIDYIEYTQNIRGILKPNQQPEITFRFPIDQIIPDSILLVQGTDSTYHPDFYFTDSATLHRTVRFPVMREEDTRFAIVIPDSSVIDWNGNHNKLMLIKFVTKSLRDYGVMVLNMKTEKKFNYILQLMTDKEVVLKETMFTNDTTITYEYLDPGSYMLKVIYDSNGNGRWDNGNYIYKIQPEKVVYFGKLLDIRANWDIEEDWKLGPPPEE